MRSLLAFIVGLLALVGLWAIRVFWKLFWSQFR